MHYFCNVISSSRLEGFFLPTVSNKGCREQEKISAVDKLTFFAFFFPLAGFQTALVHSIDSHRGKDQDTREQANETRKSNEVRVSFLDDCDSL